MRSASYLDGEQFKDIQHLNLIFDALLESGFNRDCTVLALGWWCNWRYGLDLHRHVFSVA
ncbi:hypothetical protein [Acinetobacter haemolyticus]|uniref:hypothetical protein n=1 Tax=Acinetobacter haemolyticus TaxID=29430 RepID=UPI003D1B361A